MTVRLFSESLESTPVGSVFSPHSSSNNGGRPQRRISGRSYANRPSEKSTKPRLVESFDLSLIWSSLIESLQEGIIVVSCDLCPIYWNAKAQEICGSLSEVELSDSELPVIVADICRRMMRGNYPNTRSLVKECQTANGQIIRMGARWFYPGASRGNGKVIDADVGGNVTPISEKVMQQQAFILVFIENCTDALKEELRIEQKKYDLTDREAEIWMFLKQEYTYQEIAKILQISLNTVKTHVKNVYAKRRGFQGQEKIWSLE